jgi:hypothetical protein
MADESRPSMSDYLQNRRNLLMDEWYAVPPPQTNQLSQYSDPLAPYRRPEPDTGNPVGDFFRQMRRGDLPVQRDVRDWLKEHPMLKEFGARVLQGPVPFTHGTAAWAARTPFAQRHSAITGGKPVSDPPLWWDDILIPSLREYQAQINSSTGLVARNRNSIQSTLGMTNETPVTRAQFDRAQRFLDEGYTNRNSPASNLRTPQERGWWLDTIPGGGE